MTLQRAEKWAFYFALSLVVYMPLHIFISQSFSVVTGGLEIWKAAKDVLLVLAVFPLLWLAYKQGAFRSSFFKTFIALGAVYVSLYMLFLLVDTNADLRSAITGSVYNTRILGYFLLGWVVARSANGSLYGKRLLKATLVMCAVVASFGVLQYVLPKDLLTHVGYSVERGVKPMFFIDDKPDFPRVMSTLRDPNSLGAYLAFPILYCLYFLRVDRRKQSQSVLGKRCMMYVLGVGVLCLFLTFSRSGAITLAVGSVALLLGAAKNKRAFVKRALPFAVIGFVLVGALYFTFKDSYIVKNLVLHADESSAELDPNELRLSFGRKALQHIQDYPLGEGPGTAGLVAISNPNGGTLTENYYLQIAYEVGVVGAILFTAMYVIVLRRLHQTDAALSRILFATGLGVAVFGLLNHAWSNEALAVQWWLLAGVGAVSAAKPVRSQLHATQQNPV